MALDKFQQADLLLTIDAVISSLCDNRVIGAYETLNRLKQNIKEGYFS